METRKPLMLDNSKSDEENTAVLINDLYDELVEDYYRMEYDSFEEYYEFGFCNGPSNEYNRLIEEARSEYTDDQIESAQTTAMNKLEERFSSDEEDE